MLAYFRRDDALVVSAAVLLAVAIPLGVVSCDKVPLLAPTGTVLTLLASADTAQLNSSVDIIATAIENGQASSGTGTGTGTTETRTGAGTPVQNGTVISFTTTIGQIDPTEARTHNGQVTVKLITTGQSGVATVTAYSGGASSNIRINVGSAAVDHVLLTASPQTLGPSGGTSTVNARVENVSGAGVPGVAVTFTTDAGSLSPTTATTNSDGVATTTLTTSQRATITANIAGKTATVVVGLNPRTGITLAGPTTPVAAGVPASFTVGVSATANIRNVTIDFGDGSSAGSRRVERIDNGAAHVQHVGLVHRDGNRLGRERLLRAGGHVGDDSARAAAGCNDQRVEPEPERRRDGHPDGDRVGRDVDDSQLPVEPGRERRPTDGSNDR